MTTDAIESVTRERRAAADRAFEAYDFGATEVEGTGGWEWETPGTELRRVIFLADDSRPLSQRRGGQSNTERAHFVVRFKDARSPAVQESYALTGHGGIFGMPLMSG